MSPGHAERMRACLAGRETDRPPVALWRHFPSDDQSPETLAAATLHFQAVYDFDLVKVTPASSFCLRDWGAQDEWRGDTEGTRRYTRRVVREARDWSRLRPLDPELGHLAAQLECLRLIRHGLGADVPLLQTVFSPLAQAKNLAGGELLLEHLRLEPQAVLNGLEIIAESTRRFIAAAGRIGVDGIFYAVQHAQAALLSREEYLRFGLAFDRSVSEGAAGLWCNMLHLHGRGIYFELFEDMGFPVVNWHDRETAPTLGEALRRFEGAVCGGMRQDTLALGNPAAVRAEAVESLDQTSGRRIVLGTGCVVPVIAPHGNLLAARGSVDAYTADRPKAARP
jgi:uroporphyrinogen decarboxylase